MIRQDIIELFRVPTGKKIRLRDYDTGWAQSKEMKALGKDTVKVRAKAILEKNLGDLAEAQERLETPEKHWKFSASDLAERGFWDQYTVAYEDALSATSTEWAPWYIVPADHK